MGTGAVAHAYVLISSPNNSFKVNGFAAA